jgi:hypothetical protein
MSITRRMRLLAAGVLVSTMGMIATPAQAYYVIYWANSYGGGYSYVCDNTTVYYEEGVTGVGTPFMYYIAYGQPPC